MSIFENVVYSLRIDGERDRRVLEETCERSLRGAGLCQVASERDLAGLERVSLGLAPGPDPVSSRAPTFA